MGDIALDGVVEFDLREKHGSMWSSGIGRYCIEAKFSKKVLDLDYCHGDGNSSLSTSTW